MGRKDERGPLSNAIHDVVDRFAKQNPPINWDCSKPFSAKENNYITGLVLKYLQDNINTYPEISVDKINVDGSKLAHAYYKTKKKTWRENDEQRFERLARQRLYQRRLGLLKERKKTVSCHEDLTNILNHQFPDALHVDLMSDQEDVNEEDVQSYGVSLNTPSSHSNSKRGSFSSSTSSGNSTGKAGPVLAPGLSGAGAGQGGYQYGSRTEKTWLIVRPSFRSDALTDFYEKIDERTKLDVSALMANSKFHLTGKINRVLASYTNSERRPPPNLDIKYLNNNWANSELGSQYFRGNGLIARGKELQNSSTSSILTKSKNSFSNNYDQSPRVPNVFHSPPSSNCDDIDSKSDSPSPFSHSYSNSSSNNLLLKQDKFVNSSLSSIALPSNSVVPQHIDNDSCPLLNGTNSNNIHNNNDDPCPLLNGTSNINNNNTDCPLLNGTSNINNNNTDCPLLNGTSNINNNNTDCPLLNDIATTYPLSGSETIMVNDNSTEDIAKLTLCPLMESLSSQPNLKPIDCNEIQNNNVNMSVASLNDNINNQMETNNYNIGEISEDHMKLITTAVSKEFEIVNSNINNESLLSTCPLASVALVNDPRMNSNTGSNYSNSQSVNDNNNNSNNMYNDANNDNPYVWHLNHNAHEQLLAAQRSELIRKEKELIEQGIIPDHVGFEEDLDNECPLLRQSRIAMQNQLQNLSIENQI